MSPHLIQWSTSEVISFTSLFIGRRAPLEATLCSHGWAQTITDPSSLYVLEGSYNYWLGWPAPSGGAEDNILSEAKGDICKDYQYIEVP